MISKERVKSALSELQGQSDIHLPVFAASAITGGAGLLMVQQVGVQDRDMLQDAGF